MKVWIMNEDYFEEIKDVMSWSVDEGRKMLRERGMKKATFVVWGRMEVDPIFDGVVEVD